MFSSWMHDVNGVAKNNRIHITWIIYNTGLFVCKIRSKVCSIATVWNWRFIFTFFFLFTLSFTHDFDILYVNPDFVTQHTWSNNRSEQRKKTCSRIKCTENKCINMKKKQGKEKWKKNHGKVTKKKQQQRQLKNKALLEQCRFCHRIGAIEIISFMFQWNCYCFILRFKCYIRVYHVLFSTYEYRNTFRFLYWYEINDQVDGGDGKCFKTPTTPTASPHIFLSYFFFFFDIMWAIGFSMFKRI